MYLVKDLSGLVVDVKSKYRLQWLCTLRGEIIARIKVVVHANSAPRCSAQRCKVELGLPEVHRGVVPTMGNIDVPFSRWNLILVV